MKVTWTDSDGRVDIDNKHRFFVKVPSNTPYCHLCRTQVDLVAEIVQGNPGDPRHACPQCLRTLLEGSEVVQHEQTKNRNN